jgi:hypothetical protein
MAQDEIIKHGKNIYGIAKSPHGIRHKVQETVIEILIIIFAVSASLWLHNWSEDRHARKEEKEFLTGLKEDMQGDMENMKVSEQFYVNILHGIRYFLKASQEGNPDRDSIYNYLGIFFNSTNLDPHIARYEGLKSSGKFGIIRNTVLLNDIINLHEAIFRHIEYLNELYDRHTDKLETLISQYAQLNDSMRIMNTTEMIKRSDFRIQLNIKGGIVSNNIIPYHEKGIDMCNQIIREIDEVLK